MSARQRGLNELRFWRWAREEGALESGAMRFARGLLADRGPEVEDALFRGEPEAVEAFLTWREENEPERADLSRVHRRFRPIELGDAAVASGKSVRALQHASKKGTLKAWWVHGQWWTNLAEVGNYLERHARNASRG